MHGRAGIAIALALATATALLGAWCTSTWPRELSPAEQRLITSLAIGRLPAANDPTNPNAHDEQAARLGQRLFFDPRTSASGTVSCATCHKPDLAFTDGLRVATGSQVGTRNTMSLIGAAWSPWFFWDGRKDSLWSQALAPLENSVEHATTRSALVGMVARDAGYRASYERVFGTFPELDDARLPPSASPFGDPAARAAWNALAPADQAIVDGVFANLGRALAAYQTRLAPGPTRFDAFAAAVETGDPTGGGLLDSRELAGLRLFVGDAGCIDCHNGALFTNHEFHNTGVLSSPGMLPSFGRAAALGPLLDDAFNCAGTHSGATTCAELEYLRSGDELVGAQRTPGLRNVALTAPYMHAGQIATLDEVLLHYDLAREALVGHNEAKALGLGAARRGQIVAFLQTLTAPPAVSDDWLSPPG